MRSPAVTVVALVAWTAILASQAFLGVKIRSIGIPDSSGTIHYRFDPSDGIWPQLTLWVVGVVVILAVSRLLATGARPDLLTLVGWSIGWFVVASVLFGGSEVCGPAPEGDAARTVCYAPWSPGMTWFAIWAVVSVVILIVGYARASLAARVR